MRLFADHEMQLTARSELSRRRLLIAGGAALCGGVARAQQPDSPAYRPAATLSRSGPARYIPAGQSGLKAPRIAITGEGALLENIDCSGCYVSVQASNVTLRRCRFSAVEGVPLTIDMYNGCSGLEVHHCHFDGEKKDVATDAMLRARDGVIHVADCLFENLPNDGIKMAGGSVRRCVFRSAGYLRGGHADAITVFRTVAPVVIEDNDIDFRKAPDAPTQPTSALAIGPESGDVLDVLVQRNRLRGGAYTIYVALHPSKAGKFRLARIVIRDNFIDDWLYGPLYPNRRPVDLVFQGNRRIHGGGLLRA